MFQRIENWESISSNDKEFLAILIADSDDDILEHLNQIPFDF